MIALLLLFNACSTPTTEAEVYTNWYCNGSDLPGSGHALYACARTPYEAAEITAPDLCQDVEHQVYNAVTRETYIPKIPGCTVICSPASYGGTCEATVQE